MARFAASRRATSLVALAAGALRAWALVRDGGPRTASNVYDDGVYVSAGALLRHGHLPYRDFVLVHPPAASYLIALVSFAVPDPSDLMVAMRILMVVVGIANVLLIHAIVARHVGPLEALVAAAVYAVVPEAVYAEHAVLLEPLLNLACLAAVLVWLSVDRTEDVGERPSPSTWRERLGPRPRAFGAGLLLGLACSVKLWALLCVVACLVSAPRRQGWARARELVAGTAAGVVVLWAPLFALAPRRMIDEVLLFQTRRPDDGPVGVVARVRLMLHPDGIMDTGKVRTVFIVLAVATALVVAARVRTRAACLACAWAALVVLAFLASPTWWEQYDAHLVAPFALVCGLAAHGVLQVVRAGPRHRRAPAVAMSVAAVALLCGFVLDAVRYRARHDDAVTQTAEEIRRLVPAGSSVIALDPSWLIAADRLPSVGHGRRFAVDPYGALLLDGAGLHRSLRDAFDSESPQVVDAIDSSPYLVVSDARATLMLSPELRARIATDFVTLSDPQAEVRVLRHR